MFNECYKCALANASRHVFAFSKVKEERDWKHESTHVIFPWLNLNWGAGHIPKPSVLPPARKHFYLFEALCRPI